jgi:galactokinase
VIGFTIEPAIHLVFRRRADRGVRAQSREFDGEASFEIGAAAASGPSWGDYLRGVASRAAAEHPVAAGIDAWIEGDLKPGGVASSAALQVAFLLALLDANGVRLDRARMMRLVVAAEHEGSGVQVGLLDPAVILFGEERHVVFLDCDEGAPRVQELPPSLPRFDFLVVDSGIDRELRASPYNDRVAECRAAAAALGAKGDPPCLREVTLEDLRRRRKDLDPVLARRADHVLSENKRVRTGLAALQQGDLRAFGRLVNASGQSMVRLFDAGTPGTTRLLGLLQSDAEVVGATLGGAGFGGSLVAIVNPGAGEAVFERCRRALSLESPEASERAACRVSGIGAGAGIVFTNRIADV